MKASEVMRAPAVTVAPNCRVIDAARLLMETNRRGLPVVDHSGIIVGIVSEGDFLRRVELETEPTDRPWFDAFFGIGESAVAFARAYGRSVDEIMTRDPMCVAPDADLIEAIALMESHHVAQIPVVLKGAVLGMISKAELLATVARRFDQSIHIGQGVRDNILAAIRKERWAAGAIVDVVVTNGEVQIWGVIVDNNQRKALKALIENVAGAERIVDHLKLRDELPL
ncbi:CBS domain-containing protein [Nitrobacter sp.]|nr:CBS domain-containing protein [Nitrobacter sp.]MCB1393504.1 CBS domain-containing protein [Nitrobacter sp.]MCV0387952.1 CBS domain-containing protein [Nitrobacter sp.]